jgi:hypothetical protein
MADTVTGTLSSSSSKYHVQPSLLPPATQNVRTFEQALSGEQTGQAKPAFPTLSRCKGTRTRDTFSA